METIMCDCGAYPFKVWDFANIAICQKCYDAMDVVNTGWVDDAEESCDCGCEDN